MSELSLRGWLTTSPTTTFSLIGTLWLLYLVSLAVSRLYLSPLARFPGPKAAALSRWYEFYYEVVLKGQYFRRIDEMHNQYGIVFHYFLRGAVTDS
jgi:hypothetical protein